MYCTVLGGRDPDMGRRSTKSGVSGALARIGLAVPNSPAHVFAGHFSTGQAVSARSSALLLCRVGTFGR